MSSSLQYGVPNRALIVMVLGWGLAGMVPFAQAADQPEPLTTVQEEQGKGAAEGAGNVQERGLPPPYTCSAEAGVCMCGGQANCEQMMQPMPCKRQKFCTGGQPVVQTPSISSGTQSTGSRYTGASLVICSCRSGR
jgi:hypothetical protein